MRCRAILCWLCIQCLVPAVVRGETTPSSAPATASTPDDRFTELLTRIEKLEKPEKKPPTTPTVSWTGQLQADAIGFSQSTQHRLRYGTGQNGVAFRRARFGMFGDYGPIIYRIEVDFALAGRPSLLDVFVGVKDVPGLGTVRVGHFFEPFSLERTTPNRFTTFLERSLIDEAFAPARNLGVMARRTFAENRGTLAAGLFATDSDAFGDSIGRPVGVAATGRVTALPLDTDDGERLIHIGAAYSFRQASNGRVNFRARPELRTGATQMNIPFVAEVRGVQADFFQLIGGEFLAVRGPLAVQAETHLVPIDPRPGGWALLYGGYVEVGWFVTGEHRRYNHEIGAVDRLIPRNDAVTRTGFGGPGAVELAARVSYLDLDDGTIRGGRVVDVTLGVNWYLNRYLRVTANYIHSAPAGGGQSDGFGMRMNWDF